MDSSNFEDKIQIILRQTDYTEEEAREKMVEFNNNHIVVIKNFMGVNIKDKKENIKSVNQEIYKQLRTNLDTAMREYNIRKGKIVT